MHTLLVCFYSLCMSSCKCEYMFLSVCLDMCIYVSTRLSVCLNMRMYAFISLSVFTGACMSLSPGFYPAVYGFYQCVCVCVCVCVCRHTRDSISFSASLTCTKASFSAHFLVSRGPYLLLNLHLHLTLCI